VRFLGFLFGDLRKTLIVVLMILLVLIGVCFAILGLLGLVGMAAGTTVLGMIPLLPDPMFDGMDVTIIGWLFIATLLTRIVLPVYYTVFIGLKRG
jgi:hypothetical protein